MGVGFLSLPYIALQVGFWPMVFYFFVMTIFIVFMHVIFVQISLKTPDHKRWPGFVGFYFGDVLKKFVLIFMTLGMMTTMLVYVIVGNQFLSAVLSPVVTLNSLSYFLLYLALGGFFIYVGPKIISRIDFLGISSLLLIILIILVKEFGRFKWQHITSIQSPWQDATTMFLPYGAILFSLWGSGLIPSVEEMIDNQKKTFKKVVMIGTILPAIFYIFFTFLILGITGENTTQSSLVALSELLPHSIAIIALMIGVITTFVAFITQGLLLKEILIYDGGLSNFWSWCLVIFSPLILFLMGFNSFIWLISFVGGFLLPIDGILILLIYLKIGGKKIVAYPLMTFFILGIFYELINLF